MLLLLLLMMMMMTLVGHRCRWGHGTESKCVGDRSVWHRADRWRCSQHIQTCSPVSTAGMITYLLTFRLYRVLRIALKVNPFQSYKALPAIWDHRVLPATEHRWTCPTLTSAGQTGRWLTWEGRKPELTWLVGYTLRWLLVCRQSPIASETYDLQNSSDFKGAGGT